MLNQKKLKQFIGNGIRDTFESKKKFDEKHKKISKNIEEMKEEMNERSKNRSLIRNK